MADYDASLPDLEHNPLLPASEPDMNYSPLPPPPPPQPQSPNHIESGNSSWNGSNLTPVSNGPLREEEDKITPISPGNEDQVDDCGCGSPEGIGSPPVIQGQPKSGEYAKIMELLKEAEAEADPDLETKRRNMDFLIKFNPRGGPDARLGPVDYCCSFFQCCVLCID